MAIQIRAAEVADALAIAKVHVDTWRSAYVGLMPRDLLDRLTYERRERFWQQALTGASNMRPAWVYVALDNAQVIGFSSGGPSESEPGYEGELTTLYVLDQYQGQGIGRRLMGKVVDHLIANGANSLVVWALEGALANRFYARLGGQVLRGQSFRIDGFVLNEIGYGWDVIGELRLRCAVE
jgi:GNAT superfamily N-acetyltransferase